jgi:hypothetical protein
MHKCTGLLLMGAVLAGCGEKAREARNMANAIKAVTEASGAVADAQGDAEKFYAERRAKGDTVAMPYSELQKFLPAPPNDYSASGEPSGQSQTMTGFSMSNAQQTYTKAADADGNTPTLEVTITDFGGTQAAYSMMALPMMMNLNQEDAQRRFRTLKLDIDHTWASEEFEKQTKDVKIMVVTRYRYTVTVEARNQSDDQSALVRSVAEEVTRKLGDK